MVECIEFIDGECAICGNSMVERDDFLDISRPTGSTKLAGGASPVVWIGVGMIRPALSGREPSRFSVTALASAIDECDDMGCNRCDVVDGLDSAVMFM